MLQYVYIMNQIITKRMKAMNNILVLFLCLTIYTGLRTSDCALNNEVDTLIELQDKYCYQVIKCQQPNTTHMTTLTPLSTSPPTSAAGAIYVNISVEPPTVPGLGCCDPCSCDTQRCDLFDTCCLDTLEYIPSVEESKSRIRMTCDDPQFRPRQDEKNIANAAMKIKMYQKCPLDYQNTTVILACEKRGNQTSFSTEIPVTDLTTQITYQNQYCALCHGVDEKSIKFWEVQTACMKGTFQPNSIDSIFDEVLKTETCNLIYVSPTFVIFGCDDVIAQCNITGQWQTYDPLVERACLAYTSIYDEKYKNIYCYFCNTNDVEAQVKCTKLPAPHFFVSFVALLDIETDGNSNTLYENTGKCGRHQFHDKWKDVCRDKSCLFPKTLRNGTCVYMVNVMGGVNYGVFVTMTTDKKTTFDDQFLSISDIEPAILSRLNFPNEVTAKTYVNVYAAIDALVPAQDIKQHEYSIIVHVEVESTILSPFDTMTIDRMIELDGMNLVVGNVNPVEYSLAIKELSFENDMETRVYDSTTDTMLVAVGNDETVQGNPSFGKAPHLDITITPLFQCTLITIDCSEFHLTRVPKGIHVHNLNTTLNNEDVIMETYNANGTCINSFRMCATKYDSLIKLSPEYKDINKSCTEVNVSMKGILSLVCTIISMTFLTITIVTYLVYKQLRSQPGINNVILCTSLFVAQGLFQFGSGQACNVSAFVCKLIGILIHFSWLFVLFWMNVCCIHMVKVFRQSLVNSTKKVSCRLTSFYLIYATVGGAVFVAINIVQSQFQNSEHSLGYGGLMCYISDSHMVTYLFVIPVGALVLFNTTLYIFVIMKIKQASKVHSDSRPMVERNYFKIYTKLSTLTGGTWVFGYIYLLWQIDVVEYIFIILNALHGVFLFFSFIFNKQNIKLWKDSLRSTSIPESSKNMNEPRSPTNDQI